MMTASPQTRRGSLAEAVANVVVGYVLAVMVQWHLYPVFGIVTTLAEDGLIALIFTAASLLRSYALRRLFVEIERERQRERETRRRSLERRFETGRL